MAPSLTRRVLAEALATAGLACATIGSGIMARSLTHDDAIALLANSLATAAALVVLIWSFAPISGAHMNPAVTIFELSLRRISARAAGAYVLAQICGASVGVVAANVMFGLAPVSISTQTRGGPPVLFGEVIATFGLILVVELVGRGRNAAVPAAVAAYIGSAYWFTSSTSFANPAVTIARMLTDTFGGIRPSDAPGFLAAEAAGVVVAAVVLRVLLPSASTSASTSAPTSPTRERP